MEIAWRSSSECWDTSTMILQSKTVLNNKSKNTLSLNGPRIKIKPSARRKIFNIMIFCQNQFKTKFTAIFISVTFWVFSETLSRLLILREGYIVGTVRFTETSWFICWEKWNTDIYARTPLFLKSLMTLMRLFSLRRESSTLDTTWTKLQSLCSGMKIKRLSEDIIAHSTCESFSPTKPWLNVRDRASESTTGCKF